MHTDDGLDCAGAARGFTEPHAFVEQLASFLCDDGHLTLQVGCRVEASCDGRSMDAVLLATVTESDLRTMDVGGPGSSVADVEVYETYRQAQKGGIVWLRSDSDDGEDGDSDGDSDSSDTPAERTKAATRASAGVFRMTPTAGAVNMRFRRRRRQAAGAAEPPEGYVSMLRVYSESRRDTQSSTAANQVYNEKNPFATRLNGRRSNMPQSVSAMDRRFDNACKALDDYVDHLDHRSPTSNRLRLEFQVERVRTLRGAIQHIVALLTPPQGEERVDLGVAVVANDADGYEARPWVGPPGAHLLNPSMPVLTVVALPVARVKAAILETMPRLATYQRQLSRDVRGEAGKSKVRGSPRAKLEMRLLGHAIQRCVNDLMGFCQIKPNSNRKKVWGQPAGTPPGAEWSHPGAKSIGLEPRRWNAVAPTPSRRSAHLYRASDYPFGEPYQQFTPFRWERLFHPSRPALRHACDHFAELRWAAKWRVLGDPGLPRMDPGRRELHVRYADRAGDAGAANPHGFSPHYNQCYTYGGAMTYYSRLDRGFAIQAGKRRVIAVALQLAAAARQRFGSLSTADAAETAQARACYAAVRTALNAPLRGLGPRAAREWAATHEAAARARLCTQGQYPTFVHPGLTAKTRPEDQYGPVDFVGRFSVWKPSASRGCRLVRNEGFEGDDAATFGQAPEGGEGGAFGDDRRSAQDKAARAWLATYLAVFAGPDVAPFSWMSTYGPGDEPHGDDGETRRALDAVMAVLHDATGSYRSRPAWAARLRSLMAVVAEGLGEGLGTGLLAHIANGSTTSVVTGVARIDSYLGGEEDRKVGPAAVALEATLLLCHVDFRISAGEFVETPFRDGGDVATPGWSVARKDGTSKRGYRYGKLSAECTAEMWALIIVLQGLESLKSAHTKDHRRWWMDVRVSNRPSSSSALGHVTRCCLPSASAPPT